MRSAYLLGTVESQKELVNDYQARPIGVLHIYYGLAPLPAI